MKVTLKLDCTPEEARTLMGLPDVNKLNETYVRELGKLLQGSNSIEQLQNFTKMVSPMGEAGLKLFSSLVSGAMGSGGGAKKKGASRPSRPAKKKKT